MDYDGVVKKLIDEYPGALFILNMRDMEDWLRSVGNHNDMRQRLIWADLPGLPSGKGGEDDELTAWVEKHWEDTKALFKKNGAKEKLLELKIDQDHEGARQTLQEFLKKEVKWEVHNASSRRRRGRAEQERMEQEKRTTELQSDNGAFTTLRTDDAASF
jgi:hypothetical protein